MVRSGLELASIVFDRESVELPHHTKAGVGDDHVKRAPMPHRFAHRTLDIAVAGHVAVGDERPRGARLRDEVGQVLERRLAPRRQRQLRARLTELPRELLANAR